MDERFAKMIREKLGEGAGIYYWEAVLAKSTPDLFKWLGEWHEELGKNIVSLARHHENDAHTSLRRLGFDITESDLKGMLLVVQEIRSRAMATDAELIAQAIELPAPQMKPDE